MCLTPSCLCSIRLAGYWKEGERREGHRAAGDRAEGGQGRGAGVAIPPSCMNGKRIPLLLLLLLLRQAKLAFGVGPKLCVFLAAENVNYSNQSKVL